MFAEVKGNQVVTWPYDYDTLIKRNPFTSFPADIGFLAMYAGTEDNLAGNDLVQVMQVEQPAYNPKTQTVAAQDKPTLIDGKWVLDWYVVEMTAEEKNAAAAQKSASVRQQRNQKLAETDWTQLSDSPEANKIAWATYRQELRDISKQAGFPWEVNWPQKPE